MRKQLVRLVSSYNPSDKVLLHVRFGNLKVERVNFGYPIMYNGGGESAVSCR